MILPKGFVRSWAGTVLNPPLRSLRFGHEPTIHPDIQTSPEAMATLAALKRESPATWRSLNEIRPTPDLWLQDAVGQFNQRRGHILVDEGMLNDPMKIAGVLGHEYSHARDYINPLAGVRKFWNEGVMDREVPWSDRPEERRAEARGYSYGLTEGQPQTPPLFDRQTLEEFAFANRAGLDFSPLNTPERRTIPFDREAELVAMGLNPYARPPSTDPLPWDVPLPEQPSLGLRGNELAAIDPAVIRDWEQTVADYRTGRMNAPETPALVSDAFADIWNSNRRRPLENRWRRSVRRIGRYAPDLLEQMSFDAHTDPRRALKALVDLSQREGLSPEQIFNMVTRMGDVMDFPRRAPSTPRKNLTQEFNRPLRLRSSS